MIVIHEKILIYSPSNLNIMGYHTLYSVEFTIYRWVISKFECKKIDKPCFRLIYKIWQKILMFIFQVIHH